MKESSEIVFGVAIEVFGFFYGIRISREMVETPKNTVVPALLHPGVAVRVNEMQPLGGFHDAEIDVQV